MVLSNNHVFADVNKGKRGGKLLQPGKADGGTAQDVFALLRRFRKVELGGKAKNLVDAAVGVVKSRIKIDRSICPVGKLSGTAQATDGRAVCKHGRTTGYTEGTVVDVSLDALVGMDHADPSVVAVVRSCSRRARDRAVGLYFAGPPDGSYGLANHIKEVVSLLEIRLT